MENKIFPYEWELSNTIFKKDKGTVFSCFACGGGSTMGYKLAGFDVIGFNEIDPKVAEVYTVNHSPRFSFVEDIRATKNFALPDELYNLTILDGSPPCSTFSLAGNRAKDWGKERKFKEGQSKQVLDTLFFDFIDLAERLQPKIVIAENVKGILLGKAKKYVIEIYKQLDRAGYYCQHFLLNSADMGLPQKRERVFFIALRKDLAQPFLYTKDFFTQEPKLSLEFNQRHIPFKEIYEPNAKGLRAKMYPSHSRMWDNRKYGDRDMSFASERIEGKRKHFGNNYVYMDKVVNTILAHKDNAANVLFDEKRYLSKLEYLRASSFPLDYNFNGYSEGFLMGMSVPPIMMAQIAHQVYEQWIKYF